MEVMIITDLHDQISQLKYVTLCHNKKSELIQRYLRETKEIAEFLEPVIEILASPSITVDEVLKVSLPELNISLNKVRKLLDDWNLVKSRLQFVLEIESELTKVQSCIVQACKQLRTRFLSLEILSSCECVQQCIDKIGPKCYGETSDIINVAVADQLTCIAPGDMDIEKLANSVDLVSNMELLMELASLKLLKTKIADGGDRREVNHIENMIALVDYMQLFYAQKHRMGEVNGMQVPVDICCPLSLGIMSDPVIVASGQTFEREFIKKWLDQGFTLCPRTWQKLGHSNMIPNYTVKALIANWCDVKYFNIPEPANSDSHISNNFPRNQACNAASFHAQNLRTLDETDLLSIQRSGLVLSSGDSLINAVQSGLGNTELKTEPNSQNYFYGGSSDIMLNVDTFNGGDGLSEMLEQNDFLPETICTDELIRGDVNVISDPNSIKAEAPQEGEDVYFRPLGDPSTLSGTLQRSHRIWHVPTSPISITASSSIEGDIRDKVNQLVSDLQSNSIDAQTTATLELRLLTRNSVENRIVVAEYGAIGALIQLLHSSDLTIQENSVTTLLNLSLNDNNKAAITNADSINPLIHVLRTGNQEAKANAAACLYSLSRFEDTKARIGQSEAIVSLVELLSSGTPQTKKDAATALFSLSLLHENKVRIVQAGAVQALVDMLDPTIGVVDKAVAVLANLSTTVDGRDAIDRGGGVAALVDVIELGSSRAKESAAAALLQLCMDSNHGSNFCKMALQADALPLVNVLANTGTPRAKEKARTLLGFFKNERERRRTRR